MTDKIPLILGALKDKACVKQKIYRNTKGVFDHMRAQAEAIVNLLASTFKDIDESVHIEFDNVNEFEFRIKFSGDLLMFTMHSNVIAFPPEHILAKNPYVQEDFRRGYFGHIMVYNFMADSLKYNRLADPGYLVARMLINWDSHFYIEGVRQLNFLFPDISKNQVSTEILRDFIESCMLTSINNDLIAPNYQDIQFIQLGQKLANQMVSAGEKVGFVMSYQQP